MKTFVHILLSLSISASFCACGGGKDDDNNNNNMNPMRVVERYAGGGTGGGAVSGEFSLFVEDVDDESLVGGVSVIVAGGGKTWTGQTNNEGRVDFDDSALRGPIAVHMFKAGYINESVVGINASVATFRLARLDPPNVPTPASATITGDVTGWELITAMGTPVAQVLPLGPEIVNFQQRARGGMTAASNFMSNVAFNAPDLMLHDYELLADIRAKALLVIGGTIDQMNVFTADHVGLVSPISATAGATINKDIALTHALDQSIAVDVAAPNELVDGSINVGFRFANDLGEAGLPYDPMGQVFRMPAMTGPFAGAKLVGYSSLQTDPNMAGDARASAFTRREISGASATLTLQTPPSAPSAMGRTLGTSAVGGVHLHEFYLNDLTTGEPLWSVTALSGSNVEFPTPPMGFSDPLAGMVLVTVAVEKFGDGFDPANVKFNTLGESTNYDEADRRVVITF